MRAHGGSGRQGAGGAEGDARSDQPRPRGEEALRRITLKPEALLQVVGLKGAGSDHIEVRICHSSGKNLSSSALARYDTPAVPPVPGL